MRFKRHRVAFRVRVEFRVEFLLDEICFVLSRVPIIDDEHRRAPALDVVLRLDQQASLSSK